MSFYRGRKVEHAMQKWFKGEMHADFAVDFQTKTTLYEVKSCRMFIKGHNCNHKRPYKSKPHKNVLTTHLGKFYIILNNHIKLKQLAKEENKLAKYIFVMRIGKQNVWRVISWKNTDTLIHSKTTSMPFIRLKDIFYKRSF